MNELLRASSPSIIRPAVITSLRLANFRCFEQLALDAPLEGVLITGDNAQGKTSILEAICVLIRLHSPRTHKLPALAKIDTAGFGVAGNPWQVERRIQQQRSGLSLLVDGQERATQQAYLDDGGLVVWMGNDDLELIRGPGESRRRYLDFTGSQIDPNYRRAWSRYRRALKAKNALLKEGRPRDAEIASYEEILISNGEVLTTIRSEMTVQLGPLAAQAQAAISGKHEPLTLQYLPASGRDLREAMQQARPREIAMGQSLVGPHRDQLALRIHGLPAAEFASEGQQRTLALALKLAQGALLAQAAPAPPIYLLDDIFGELDPSRRNALINYLPQNAQKWITTTHLGWLTHTPAVGHFHKLWLRNGRVCHDPR